nr:ubiquitin-activating enzyme E1 1-like isoform X2 [Tanacetum cinerariifolium]
MGVSCGTQGKLTVTDDDVIEKINLNRQFLFQPGGPETEKIFDDTFWENLNVVVNALDHVNAIFYVEQRCLYFQKPLLESGTLGAKCNTQMVIPHLTENYGASRDPPAKQAPMFEDYFANRMKQLIFTFLEDAATSIGAPFCIPDVEKLRAKFIVGRIIPKIATSTTMATSLVCLELYKVIGGGRKVEDYLNTFANLALPLFSMAEPVPPKVIKHQDLSWTVWDMWTIKGNPTLRELIKWLADKGPDDYSISCGSCLLFNSMFSRHNEQMHKNEVDLARDVAKMEILSYLHHLDLMVACEDEEENDIDISQVEIGTFFPLVVLRSLDGSDYPLNLKLSVLCAYGFMPRYIMETVTTLLRIAQGTQKVDQNSVNATQTGSIKGSSLQCLLSRHLVKGIEFLKSNSLVENMPVSVAQFLINMPSLDKAPIGDYLGQH